MEKLKVLLLNQNPMIKKLVTMACGKLNLDVENVARIPADFRARDYVCIIVDDENVGKNLEKLTTLQDKIKVCLLFSRKTQVKHHEFNIAIQKPFLPTEILEVLNACIPSEEELAKRAQKDKSIEAADKTKEINMDLKSAEVNMPDILGKDAKPDIHINKEALESEAKDTKDLEDFDFDPDTLDLDALEKASGREDIESTHKDSKPKETGGMVLTTKDEPHEDSKDSGLDSISDFDNLDFSGIDGVSSEDSKDSTKDKEQDSKGAFDKDLSDLKDSKDSKKSDNPLDLANFDLDSMIDASALKSASSGLKKEELEKQAREAAENHSDDDLFLDEDDELAKLRPKPKDFLKAKESEAKAGGADSIKDSIKDSGADSAGDSIKDSINKDSGLDSISDFDNLDFSGIDGVSEDSSKDSKDTKDSKTKQKKTENIESNTPNTTQKNATNTASNIDSNTLDSINEIDNLDLSDLGGDLSSDLSGDLSQNVASNFLDTLDETSKTPEITALAPNENALNADISSDIDLASTLQNLDSKDSKDSIKDLGVSNAANKDSTNAASERATNESLDNAFADLSAALENAFGNLDEDDGTHNMDFHDFVAKQNMQDSSLDSTLDSKQDSIKDSIKDSGTSANLKDTQSNFLENIEIPSEDSTKNERATNESLDNAFADLSAALENAFGNLDEDDGTHNMDFHDFVAKQNMQDSALDSSLDSKQDSIKDSIKDSSLDSIQDSGVSNVATDSINTESTLDSNLDSSILETSPTQDTTDSTLDFLNDSTNIESTLDFLNDSSTNLESKTQDSTLDSILDSSLDFLNDSATTESTNLDSTLDFLNDSSTNADSILANEPLENALNSDPKAESNMDLESLGLDSSTDIKEDSTLDFLNDSTNIESSLDFLNDSSTNLESKTQDSTLDSILDSTLDLNNSTLDSTLDFLNDSATIESTSLDSTLDFLNDSSTNADSLLANEPLENALNIDPKAESNMDLESLGLDSSTQITEDSTFNAFSDSSSDFFKDLHEISQNNIESKKVSSDFASDSTQELLINDDASPTHILDKDELSSVSDLLKEVNEMPINPPDSKTDSKETSEITESSTPETNEESKPPLSPELEALKDVKHIFPSNIENIGDLNESQLATALGEGDDSFAKLDKALSADDEKALNDAKDSIESSTPQDLNTESKEPQDEIHAELESMEDSLEQKENMESMADLGDDLNAIFDLESSPDSAMQTLESKMESTQDSAFDLNLDSSLDLNLDSNDKDEITESSTDSSLDLNLDSKDLDLSAPQDSNLDSTLDFLNDTKNDKELNLENTLDFSLDSTQDFNLDLSLDSSLDSKESLDLTQDSKDSKDTLDFLNDSNFTLDLDEPKEPQKLDSTTEPSLDFDFDNTEHQKLESNLKKSVALDSIFHTDSSISSLDFNFETPLDSNIETEAKNLENIESNDTKNLENLKQMDAKSFINFIKDTPSDKLDKILENADISLNIQFGKKS